MIPTDDHGSDLFSSIAGLPLHPLVVHLAVVVLPASALALIAIVAVPRWRRPYGWLTVAAAMLGTGGAFVAKESGEALADQVGLPAGHAQWGDRLVTAAAVFAVVTLVWFALDLLARGVHPSAVAPTSDDARAADVGRGSDKRGRATATTGARSGLARVTGGAVVVLSLVVLALTVAVGHSGATAVWAGNRTTAASTLGTRQVVPAVPGSSGRPQSTRPPASSQAGIPQPSASAPPATRPATSGPAAFSLGDVRKHQSGASCWAAIAGEVYDLTRWISAHPGGSDAILGICGTDATAAFNAQHGGQGRPARELATFKIGVLR